jgi:GT2 family glycosyltransferase
LTDLVAVVVTYNRLDKLRKTTERLLSEAIDYIVVVDNASNDGTQDWLKSQHDSRLHCVFNSNNLGGAGGFEVGMREAIEQFDPKWLLVQDDDAWPMEGAIERFLSTDLTDVDAAAAAVFYPDGRICEMNRPSRNPFWHLKEFAKTLFKGRDGFHISHDDYVSNTSTNLDATSFVGFFVRGEVVKTLGYPDPQLFIYGDDVIYTLNLSKQGYRLRFLPWVKYEHDCSTFVNHVRVYDPIWKVYYTYRNGLIMYRVAAGWFFGAVLPYKLGLWFVRGMRYENKKVYYKLLWLSIRDGLFKKTLPTHDEIIRVCEQQ